VNRDQIEGLLYVRGILLGSPLRGDRLRGMYGMYGCLYKCIYVCSLA
jgi:hypothetical protein